MKRFIVALTCLALPSSVALPSRADVRFSLKGTNVIRGSGATAIPVRVPRDITVDNPWLQSESTLLEIKGKGRFVGFALISDPMDPEKVSYLGGRLPRSADSRMFFFYGSARLPDSNQLSTIDIDAGNYLLYLLPGSSPAEITLRLPGLRGSTELHPEIPVDYVNRKLEPWDPQTPKNVWSARAASAMPRPGIVFTAAWYHADAHAVTEYEACWWGNRARYPEAMMRNCWMGVMVPPNLGGSQRQRDQVPAAGPHLRLYYGSKAQERANPKDADARRIAISYRIDSAAIIENLDDMAIWIQAPKYR